MSLSEHEIMDRFVQSLKEAKNACELLGLNADPEKIAPRGHNYGNLRRALRQLEGSCRQMTHFRSDTRWVRLGIWYAKLMRIVLQKFNEQDWLWFKKADVIFESGLAHMRVLADMKTGVRGPILPTRPSTWLQMPDVQKQRQRLVS